MKPTREMIKSIYRASRKLTADFFDLLNLLHSIMAYPAFIRDLYRYRRMPRAEHTRILDIYPCLLEKTSTTSFDAHYFYQDTWAFKKVYESQVTHHVDVGSSVMYIGMLSMITDVVFVDIRPLTAKLDRLYCRKGSILSLPYKSNSVQSLSCLNVAEHVGLGRYGDPLDPQGTVKSARELSRVLAPNGNLYFSLPVGRPRLCFNAHRIHSPRQIIGYFHDLSLIELSGVTDDMVFERNIDINVLEKSSYACGLFWFRKEPW